MPGDIKIDVGQLISGAGTLAKDLRSAITGEISPEKKAELEIRAQEVEAQIMTAQTAINQEEAKSSNWFVAGWRPAVGWVGVISLSLAYWPKAILLAYAWISSVVKTGVISPYPDLGLSEIIGLLVSVLGVGIMRSAEKIKGVAGDH
jgi:hypothetical protein